MRIIYIKGTYMRVSTSHCAYRVSRLRPRVSCARLLPGRRSLGGDSFSAVSSAWLRGRQSCHGHVGTNFANYPRYSLYGFIYGAGFERSGCKNSVA